MPTGRKKNWHGIYLLFSGCIAWMEVAPVSETCPKVKKTAEQVQRCDCCCSDALELIFLAPVVALRF
jgi:PBP1b-binding outer membrane lipoprotein LpoB